MSNLAAKAPLIVSLYIVAAFGQTQISFPTPDYCNELPSNGSGRARIERYRYRSEGNFCEKFIWGGGQTEPNIFDTREDCQRTCVRNQVQPRASTLSCSFSANLDQSCSLIDIVDSSDIIPCNGLDLVGLSRQNCTSYGCCWNFGVCYQKRSSLVQSSCLLHQETDMAFWGTINFQSNAEVFQWVGAIEMTETVRGDFCIIRPGHNYVDISPTTFANRTHFILTGRVGLRKGEQVTILFQGRLDDVPLYSPPCGVISSSDNSTATV